MLLRESGWFEQEYNIANLHEQGGHFTHHFIIIFPHELAAVPINIYAVKQKRNTDNPPPPHPLPRKKTFWLEDLKEEGRHLQNTTFWQGVSQRVGFTLS